eukprot:CAMPEP_0179904734 /NCGR_PEP_ID=MMETSP0982-20121206/42125_1 /TAXON_ID=483367 /ORGANISM="non described non described, Strain CCMP 2436" /LENGTH=130 /DNA_ID=CAMNT_0021804707 /DNA_START=46 /DNA_END=435 /DNA_ORIENTATION=+
MTRSTHLFILKTGRGGGGAATGVAGASVLAGIASVAPLPLAPALPSSLAMPHTDAQTIVKRKRASSSRNHSDDSLVAKGKHNTFTWKCDKCPTIEICVGGQVARVHCLRGGCGHLTQACLLLLPHAAPSG